MTLLARWSFHNVQYTAVHVLLAFVLLDFWTHKKHNLILLDATFPWCPLGTCGMINACHARYGWTFPRIEIQNTCGEAGQFSQVGCPVRPGANAIVTLECPPMNCDIRGCIWVMNFGKGDIWLLNVIVRSPFWQSVGWHVSPREVAIVCRHQIHVGNALGGILQEPTTPWRWKSICGRRRLRCRTTCRASILSTQVAPTCPTRWETF